MCDKAVKSNNVDIPPMDTFRSSQCSTNWLRESIDVAELTWRSSTKHIDPGYGFEKEWRPLRGRVEGREVSRSSIISSPDDKVQWRSCIRYIPPPLPATVTESDETRRSCGKKHVQPISRDPTPDWKPGLRIFRLSECSNEWKMEKGRRHIQSTETQQEEWRSSRGRGQPPPSKWIPPFRNSTSAPSSEIKSGRRKVPCYTKNHPEFELFSARSEKPSTGSNTKESTNAREIRAKVSAYFESHPPLHLFSNTQETENDSGRPKNGTYHHAVKRYIPEGHDDQLENVACAKASRSRSRGKMLCATGSQRDPVECRNVILGNIDKSDEWKPNKVKVLAPASRHNEDIISNRFSLEKKTLGPLTSTYKSDFKNNPVVRCQSARDTRFDETYDPIISSYRFDETFDPIVSSYRSRDLKCNKENVKSQRDKSASKNVVKAKEWKTGYASHTHNKLQRKWL